MRKYMYLNVKKVEKLSSKGREIIPKFVEFCEVFVHNATNDLNDEEFREWIHSGWPPYRFPAPTALGGIFQARAAQYLALWPSSIWYPEEDLR